MPKKTKQTIEQKRERDRLQKQKKYAEIKKDPEKYAEAKEKERARYLKKKENKKIKNAEDMTPRQLRNRRKMWRINSKRHYENKKKEKVIQQLLIDNSPPNSDTETLPAEQDPLARRAASPMPSTSQNGLGMSSNKTEEAAPCGGQEGALKGRATPGDTSRAGELDVPELVDMHFVSIVRGYEELYMCDHPLYRDRQRRRHVWEEIGTIVNQPAEDCKKRWTRIRENYFGFLKRAKQDANETAHQVERPAHEKLMSFLNPAFETKKELTKFKRGDKIATTVLDSDKEAPESESDDSSDADNSLSVEKYSSDVSDSSSSDDVQGSPRTGQAAGAALAAGQQQSQLEHDDVVDFFVELGESVKDFPEGVRIHVKREAFKIVTDAEEMLYHQKIKADLEMNMSEEHE